jgi:hypothetical protein
MLYNATLKDGNSSISNATLGDVKTWLMNLSTSYQLDETKLPTSAKPKPVKFRFGTYSLIISLVKDEEETEFESESTTTEET